MKTVLVTGSNGFIGKNLVVVLKSFGKINIRKYDVKDDEETLKKYVEEADIIYHLAGVNRPQHIEDFETGNTELTKKIIHMILNVGKTTTIIMSSSVQAELDNPYGISKKKAEDELIKYSKNTGANVGIYRLPNVFGKWCKPNYNSVVATFCYNISHGLDITISNVNNEIQLAYIDDIVNEFINHLKNDEIDYSDYYFAVGRTFKTTLGNLAEKLYQIRDIRKTSIIPDMSDELTKCLYATYLSYVDKEEFSYKLDMKIDNRGNLAELLKSNYFGQIFASKSNKGIIRGNHYHHSKHEKFIVIQGQALVKLRNVLNEEIISYYVSGDKIEVVDIPPGYTHSIENLTEGELIVLFWANEIFNSQKPDTYYEEV